MSLSHPSPICTVNTNATPNGVNVSGGSTVTIALADPAGVKTWSIVCTSTDDMHTAAGINAGLTVDIVTHTATFTAPAATSPSALIFRSEVNQGRDNNGRVDSALATTFGVYVPTATHGLRVGAWDETTEGNAACGWVAKVNALTRLVG